MRLALRLRAPDLDGRDGSAKRTKAMLENVE